MIAAFTRAAVALALLARLTAGAKVCGRVPDCVIDVGRACARKHLPRRLERAAAAKVVAGRNSQDVDSDGCYTVARDELSEDDVFSERELYTGEARETAWKIMHNVHSKEARRFKRLQDEELSRMKARGEL